MGKPNTTDYSDIGTPADDDTLPIWDTSAGVLKVVQKSNLSSSSSADVQSVESSSTDGQLVQFNSTTGKQIKKFSGNGVLKASSGVVAGSATLDDVGAPTVDFSMANHKITNVTDPSNAQDAATKAYVDAAAAGIDWKASVRVATTTAQTLSTDFENGDTIDGVVLATGDRVLIKDQATASENGIYTVNASGSPTRAADANADAEVTGGMAVWVSEGTANGDTGWVLTTNDTVTVGVTNLVFTQFTGLGSVTAGAGLTKTANTLTVGAGTGITVNADDVAVDSTVYRSGGTDVAIADGGTGASSKAAAFDALSPMTASGDVIYGGTAGTGTRLAKGTDGQVLTLASGVPTWASASSGGQNLVTKVVAASGGDYTTLGAALAAASAGWTIYVKDDTTETGAITCALDNITILGAGAEETVIDLSSYLYTHSGTFLRVANVKFTMTTGGILSSGADAEFYGVHITKTGATNEAFESTATRCTVQHCRMSSTTTTSLTHFTWTADLARIVGNYFECQASSSSSFNVTGGNNGSMLANNTIVGLSTSTSTLVYLGTGAVIATGNNIYMTAATGTTVSWASSRGTFSSNNVWGGNRTFQFGPSAQFTEVSGNSFKSGSTGGYSVSMINVSATSCYDNSFVGNHVYDTDSARSASTFIDQSATNEGVTAVTGNFFYRAMASGSAYICTLAQGVVFSGNYLYGGGSRGIQLTGSHNLITGNSFWNQSGNSIVIAANTQTIVGNQFRVDLTNPIDFSTYIGIEAMNNKGANPNCERHVLRLKNTSGSTITAGETVIYKAVANGNEITTTTAAGDTKLWGMAEESISNNATGSVLITGHTKLLKVNGTADIAIGDYLTSYTTAGIAAKTAGSQLCHAIALEAYTADDSSGIIDAVLIPPRVV